VGLFIESRRLEQAAPSQERLLLRSRRLTPWKFVVRATTRQWLNVKYVPPGTRAELTNQAILWVALLLALCAGLLGLAAPLA